jgi:RND family efflux transporter MFP subunit
VQGNQAAYALLAADAAGVVTEVQAEPGQVLSAGQPVLRLAHDGPRDVVFAVPEDKISMLRSLLGRPGAIKVRLWGSEALLPGTVREVAAATDATTRTVRVKVDIGRATVTLGQTATVLIDVPQTQTAIKLPMSALTEVGGATSVWLLDGATMTVRPQAVQVGGAEGNLVLVAGGLLPGAEVVTAGVHVLTPGQVVRRYAGDADKARSDAQSGSAPAAVAAASR